jgi:hypoxanthine phosphoribosyltransferase
MENYKYTEEDLDIVSWERIDEFIDKIYSDVSEYLKKNNLSIKYIVPILRGGGIPALKLSHMFDVVNILPIQLKYNAKTSLIEKKISLDDYENIKEVGDNEVILLVEGNHCTGRTANIACKSVKEKFGENVKVIYVSLTRDYTYKDSVEGTVFTTWAWTTNESKRLTKEECEKLNIDYHKVSVYPWENAKEELEELNEYDA